MEKGDIASVLFDEENHIYTYKGRKLNGITGLIGRKCGKAFPTKGEALTNLMLKQSYGSQVHKEVERYFNEKKPVTMKGAEWVLEQVEGFLSDKALSAPNITCEVRVSDFVNTASNVDIVIDNMGEAYIFDIKTGAFDRTYCTMQLNAYRLMYENCYNGKIAGMYVLGYADKRLYNIFSLPDEYVLAMLDENI